MRDRRPLLASTAGAVAALVYFGSSEFLAGVLALTSAPLLILGQTVIPLVPTPLIKAAIAVFGTNDKLALVITIAVVGVVIGGLIGWIGVRRRSLSLVLLAGFGALPIVLQFTAGGSLAGMVPAVVGVVLGCAAYLGLLRLAEADGPPAPAVRPTGAEATRILTTGETTGGPGGTTDELAGPSDEPAGPSDEPAGSSDEPGGPDRRLFFGIAAGLGAIGVAAIAAGQSAAVLARNAAGAVAQFVLPRPAASAPPIPDGADLEIDSLAPIITPNSEFYRIDTALVPPAVDAGSWSLRIHGMVDREVTVTMEELLALPLEEHYVTLTCVSNEVGGDLIGNAKWLGYPIRELLARAGPTAGADMVLSGSDDGFTASTPLEVLTDDRAALLAVGMNGKPLPRDHGFPARLVVPGLYGFVSATKWVTSLEVTRFADKQAYWTTRGWLTHGPVLVASRVDVPRSGVRVRADGGKVVAAGMAWAQHTGIGQVQVRLDEGDWQTAQLSEELNVDTWRQWSIDLTGVSSGSHTVTVRATDKDGNVQISDRRPAIPGSTTGLHARDFTVE
ncbi:molybdopterin-dependent oxidoreductase [Brevibacterium casei]